MTVCDFVAAIKQCQIVVSLLYVSLETCYNGDRFSLFFNIATITSQFVLMRWMPDLSAKKPTKHMNLNSSKVS